MTIVLRYNKILSPLTPSEILTMNNFRKFDDETLEQYRELKTTALQAHLEEQSFYQSKMYVSEDYRASLTAASERVSLYTDLIFAIDKEFAKRDRADLNLTPTQRVVMEKLANSSTGTIQVATSQYAENTVRDGFHFDAFCNSPALRGLEKRGLIQLESSWRCATVSRVAK